MTAVALGRFEPQSSAWHEVRQSRLGGSEIAAVLGLSPWQSRFSLWHEKLGMVDRQPDDPLLTAGRYVESAIADWFADQHPDLVVSVTGTWNHPERQWQLANPDRLLFARGPRGGKCHRPVGILECKFSPYGDGWGTPGTDEIPVYYRCQSLWYSDVFGGLPVYVAGLVGNEFGCWRVDFDPEDAQILRDAGAEFMDSVEQRLRPDIDAHSQTYQILREQHPDIEPGDVEIDVDLAGEYLAATIAEREAKAAKQHAGSQILDQLGSYRSALCDGQRVAYRRAAGPDKTPYLMPDPKAVKALTYQPTIQEVTAA